MRIFIIFTFVFISFLDCTKSQNFGSIDLKEVNNSVVFLREVRNKIINQNGYDYQIGLKDPETGDFFPYKTEFTGTGFTLTDSNNIYFITTKHLAKNLTDSSYVKFSGARLDTLFKLRDVLYKIGSSRWYSSENADIAIGVQKINFKEENDTIKFINRRDTSKLLFSEIIINSHILIPTFFLRDTLIAPFRDMELLAVGYPNGIGDYRNPKTTVSKFFRSSSEMIISENEPPFFIIDDPSVDGLSGSLAIEAPLLFETNNNRVGNNRRVNKIVGMINGTFNDSNGGKFTSVIPAKLILDEIKKVKKTPFIDDYFYKNGNKLLEIATQNGKYQEILSNYDKYGNPQDKGTLKNGNGTIKIYDKNGKLQFEYKYENGIFKNYIYPKNEKK